MWSTKLSHAELFMPSAIIYALLKEVFKRAQYLKKRNNKYLDFYDSNFLF